MKKEFGEYYLGLDIGTNSVGWAVTDTNYNIQKFNGKAMWGIRLFREAKTAEERRLKRSARRRQQRKVGRIQMLQTLFAEEIMKIDPKFYERMKDSAYYEEDKRIKQPNAVFDDSDYQDKNYHMEYPTIYHLRAALLQDGKKFDIRLVYLALHHLLKHRGHFLFEGQNMKSVTSFEPIYYNLKQYVYDAYEVDLSCVETKQVQELLLNHKISKSDKKKQLCKLFYTDKSEKAKTAILGLMAGSCEKLCDIFQDESLKESDPSKICFGDASYEENRMELEAILEERCYLIDKLKAVYDWALLSKILQGSQYISVSKVKTYEKHKYDLQLLKGLVKKYCPESYTEIFNKVDKKSNNYCSYIGLNCKNGKKQSIEKSCTQEEFCKYISGIFADRMQITTTDEELLYLQEELSAGTLLPKQITKDNGVIPFQVHEMELIKILDNAEKYLPFLSQKDSDGYTPIEKIISIFEFRIPYYVGPLNDAHKDQGSNCWIVKRSQEKITPWNFSKVVDLEASAEAFILRMTNKCTYLPSAEVLPKNSLLYSEFTVLNELNNVKIGQEKLSVDLKQRIVKDLFMKFKKVTGKRLNDYLVKEGIKEKEEELSGFDENFNSSLTSYIDFKKILQDKIKQQKYQEIVEQIIMWMALYGEDQNLLMGKIKREFGEELTEEEQRQICHLRYSGWGKMSREFLMEIVGADKEIGEVQSIIQALRNTQDNLMQLLSQRYTYLESIEEYNQEEGEVQEITYELLDGLYLSPSVKHMLWQTLVIVKELKEIMGHEPKKIFIEMARGEGEKKKRTESRKNKLVALYKDCKKEERDWIAEINSREEGNYRRDRLYLYYTQKGRCMYSGEKIDLDNLYNENIYDVDHIYPRSKTKDDSLENRVLVKRNLNAQKTDAYPISREIQQHQYVFWKDLHEHKFIGDKKYDRLTRTSEFTEAELADFIARQLVETRQTTKATADLLKRVFKESKIVYAKAGNVSDFRQKFQLIKVRDVNDYHHAQDAYLNIVVGNVYDTKFTSNPVEFIKRNKEKGYSLNRVFDYKVENNNITAWEMPIKGKEGTIGKVKHTMAKNNIRYTRASFEEKGSLFNETLYSKEICMSGIGYVPLKGQKNPLHQMEKYGGYGKIAGSYFFAVEHTVKGKRIKTIEHMPIYLKQDMHTTEELLRYCIQEQQLLNPRILIKKIKMQSLIRVDGYPLYLTGRTGNYLLVTSAVPLCLSGKQQQYVKNIVKF
ncbi:MAG: type II CRISPR RNA-guided endonuclease Cas9, partial [Acetivibrio sp.]